MVVKRERYSGSESETIIRQPDQNYTTPNTSDIVGRRVELNGNYNFCCAVKMGKIEILTAQESYLLRKVLLLKTMQPLSECRPYHGRYSPTRQNYPTRRAPVQSSISFFFPSSNVKPSAATLRFFRSERISQAASKLHGSSAPRDSQWWVPQVESTRHFAAGTPKFIV
jgi:hypothetical protein